MRQELEPFFVRLLRGESRDGTDDFIELKSVVSRSSLPASIFEKSRMSLMIASSEVPALWTLLT